MYTRGGDKGETSLYGASRVAKDSPRVEAYGTIDELNSLIGVALSFCGHEEIETHLRRIQEELFAAGADLASDPKGKRSNGTPRIEKQSTQEVERAIDTLQEKLPRLTRFVMPGGGRLSASLHVARAVCRRAERRVVALGRAEKVSPEMVPYLNRLSTLLFNLARYADLLEGVKEETWGGRGT